MFIAGFYLWRSSVENGSWGFLVSGENSWWGFGNFHLGYRGLLTRDFLRDFSYWSGCTLVTLQFDPVKIRSGMLLNVGLEPTPSNVYENQALWKSRLATSPISLFGFPQTILESIKIFQVRETIVFFLLWIVEIFRRSRHNALAEIFW